METKTEQARLLAKHILLSAGGLLAKVPVDQVRMERVAAKARVSKATLYKYYRSKEELVKAVVNLDVDNRTAILRRMAANDEGSVKDKLEWMVHLEFLRVRNDGSERMDEMIEKDREARARLYGCQRAVLKSIYEQGLRDGEIDPNLPFEVFYWHWELYRAGLRAKARELKQMHPDASQDFVELLSDAYLFGAFVNYGAA